MRLFHVSEDPDIKIFEPRTPKRGDVDTSKPLVWAINEKCLPNFLTPRDCPRVTYHATNKSSEEDIEKFFSTKSYLHCVAIENKWYKKMTETILYLYEFETSEFYRQDECAGYYVSEKTQVPVNVIRIDDLFGELFLRSIEVRLLDNLWCLAESVKKTSLNWSLCRMGFAHCHCENKNQSSL